MRRARKALQWFSDNWPLNLEWPSDIPRPVPTPDSPATRILLHTQQNNPLIRLNTKGEIADVKGFCWRLSAQRSQFDQVVRQYRDGGTRDGQCPRRGSKAWLIWQALCKAGDVRFKGAWKLLNKEKYPFTV